MTQRKTPREYLQDILEYLDKAAAFTREGREAFYEDDKTQLAVIRAYEVVGEIVKRLPQDLYDANPQIDWRKLAGFRDFLSHNYDEIILEFIWQAIEDLPALRNAIHRVLENLSSDS